MLIPAVIEAAFTQITALDNTCIGKPVAEGECVTCAVCGTVCVCVCVCVYRPACALFLFFFFSFSLGGAGGGGGGGEKN